MAGKGAVVAWHGAAECDSCGFRQSGLFADLAAEDLRLNALPIDRIEFGVGSVLFRAGDTGRTIFTVQSGLVKLVQYLPSGGQRIVRLLRAGDVAGIEALLGVDYEHTAIALRSVLACRIPCATIHAINNQSMRLHDQLMRRWHQYLRQADEWLTMLSTGSARARVARLLLYLHDAAGDDPCEMFSREDVAAMLGITTETASRVVAEFRRDRAVIAIGSNRVTCDAEKLRQIALN